MVIVGCLWNVFHLMFFVSKFSCCLLCHGFTFQPRSNSWSQWWLFLFPPRGLNHLLATLSIFIGYCKRSSKKQGQLICLGWWKSVGWDNKLYPCMTRLRDFFKWPQAFLQQMLLLRVPKICLNMRMVGETSLFYEGWLRGKRKEKAVMSKETKVHDGEQFEYDNVHDNNQKSAKDAEPSMEDLKKIIGHW